MSHTNFAQVVFNLSTSFQQPAIPDITSLSHDTISSLVQGVVANVALREHNIEQFENEPLEFIRLDLFLSSSGTNLMTRRASCCWQTFFGQKPFPSSPSYSRDLMIKG